MAELREKTSYTNKEIEELTEQLDHENVSDKIKKISTNQIRIYPEEIEEFLTLENVTNVDLRKIIGRIVVKREGQIKIYLRDFSDFLNT